MKLRNKTGNILNLEGKTVRPYREIEVSDDAEYNNKEFQVVEEIKTKTKKLDDKIEHKGK